MVAKTVYNYDKTIEILQKIANTSEVISKADLMIAMMGRVAANELEDMRFGQALVILRKRLSNLNLKLSLFTSGGKNRETTYAVVSAASEVKEEQKESVVTEPSVDDMRSSMHSLQTNNQKLYNENEKLNVEIHELRARIYALEEKESHYKNVINSFYALAMA